MVQKGNKIQHADNDEGTEGRTVATLLGLRREREREKERERERC